LGIVAPQIKVLVGIFANRIEIEDCAAVRPVRRSSISVILRERDVGAYQHRTIHAWWRVHILLVYRPALSS
jgi:hypothetical protein